MALFLTDDTHFYPIPSRTDILLLSLESSGEKRVIQEKIKKLKYPREPMGDECVILKQNTEFIAFQTSNTTVWIRESNLVLEKMQIMLVMVTRKAHFSHQDH